VRVLGLFHDNGERDVYACIGCGLPLFRSNAKFDSGTGWPRFFQPVAAENIGTERHMSHGMIRTEIHCVRCNSHLGHAFNDGTEPTGLLLGHRGDVPQSEGRRRHAGRLRRGHTQNPTYEDVCSHTTGHAEVVEVEFDPVQISLRHCSRYSGRATSRRVRTRTGPDEDSQYRSGARR
jgi:peptide methionine sulfoxide reductase msrA/msrB